MLGFAPRLYDDETIFSALGRQGALLGEVFPSWISDCQLRRRLLSTHTELPANLISVARQLSPHHDPQIVASHLIEGHTAFGYLLRFAPAELRLHIRERMLGPRPPSNRIGVMSSFFPPPARLRVCLKCLADDQRFHGEVWWHRVHQLAGVVVCPIHGEILRDTVAPATPTNPKDCLLRPFSVLLTDRHPKRGPRVALKLLIEYAQSIEELLGPTPIDSPSMNIIHARLREILGDFHWKRAPSLFDTQKMARAFLDSPVIRPLLEIMDVRLPEGSLETALNRVLYRERQVKHPLLVLMLLRLAGATMADLMITPLQVPPKAASEALRAPSGQPPCGNPACIRYTGNLKDFLAREDRPRAVLRCGECGFSYRWSGTPARRLTILVTCPSWDAHLGRLLDNPDLSTRRIAATLGIATSTLERRALRLGRVGRARSAIVERCSSPDRAAFLRARHRANWLAGAPYSQSIKRLPQAAFAAYRYLHRHDREWLAANHPPIKRYGPRELDWAARDAAWVAEAEAIVRRIEASGARSSMAQVARALGKYVVISQNKSRLPKVWTAVKDRGKRVDDPIEESLILS